MSVIIQGAQLRTLLYGRRADAAAYTLAVETKTIFTIAGGAVAIQALYGYVSTAITVANTVKLQANPTTGATGDLCAATDIGTTDTPAGDFLSVTGVPADSIQRNVGFAEGFKQGPLILNTGTIEQVTATGADGVVTWTVLYVPVDAGATIS